VRGTLAGKLPALGKADDLRKQLNAYKADNLPRVMVMSDERPRETAILDRGEYLKPREKVAFATPAFLPPLPEGAPTNRLGLAQWLVSPSHPLTARVQVNRMWQQFFGQGIVKTSEDFGVQSEYPLHGPLLDWLAVEFRESGWRVKALQKRIVMSATYRQSSRVSAEMRTRDAENRLYARASRFRMPSLVLRDWALSASGLLIPKLGGKPVYPYQPDAVWESLAITKERDFTYPASRGDDAYAGRHHHRGGVLAGELAEIAQHDGVASEIFWWQRAVFQSVPKTTDAAAHRQWIESLGTAQVGHE